MKKVDLPYKREPGVIMLHPQYYKGCVLNKRACNGFDRVMKELTASGGDL